METDLQKSVSWEDVCVPLKNLLLHIYHAVVPGGIMMHFNIQHHSDICTEYSGQEPKPTRE